MDNYNAIVPTYILIHLIEHIENYLDDNVEDEPLIKANIQHDINIIKDYIDSESNIEDRLLMDLREFRSSGRSRTLYEIAKLLEDNDD